MKGHMQDGKFHPHTEYKKGVRKSRDQSEKTEGVRLARQRVIPKLTRVKEQEDSRVKYWAESPKGNTVASLIYSKDFPDEMEIRIGTLDGNFSVRGHKSIMDKMSFEEFKNKALNAIETHEDLAGVRNAKDISEEDKHRKRKIVGNFQIAKENVDKIANRKIDADNKTQFKKKSLALFKANKALRIATDKYENEFGIRP